MLNDMCSGDIAATAVDLFWLAGLGWEYLDKQREQADLVYGYPDLVSGSILTVNRALLAEYSSAVENAYGRQLPVCEGLRHPRNLPIYRWFDNDLGREPQRPELAPGYTAALNKLHLVTFALAKLELEIGEEYRLLQEYLEHPRWHSWTPSIWGGGNDKWQKRVEGVVELWLAGSQWHTQGDERARLVTEALEAWKHAEALVKGAEGRGELQMSRWALPAWDEWLTLGIDC